MSGDAGFVARPHTVAGFAKAFENANALSTALQNSPSIDAALADYNSSQLSTMQRAVALGERLGKGTVLEVPSDIASWNEEHLKDWLSNLTDIEGKLNVFTKS